MNATDREQIRYSILRYCLRPTAVGLICAYLRGEGQSIKRDAVELEIEYLRDKNFLAPDPKSISPEVPLWRTTAAGRDELALRKQEAE